MVYSTRATGGWSGVLREAARRPYGGECGSDPGTPACGARPPSADLVDRVDDLGDEIAILAAHLHSGRQRFLSLIARFDRLRGWEPSGHRSCAYWLAWRTGLDLGTAREHVRVARSLEDLPRTSDAMARGSLSFSQVRALTRAANAETEADLLELAEGCTTHQLERVIRAWKKGSRAAEAERERELHRSRKWSVFPDDEGMYVVNARLDPEVGAVLLRAVEAATDAVYRKSQREAPPPFDQEGRGPREAARRRADAIGLVAERALAAGFGAPTTDPEEPDTAPTSGSRAERYQVVVHVEAETLSAEQEPGRSELEDGTRVSAETSRRISCDAGVVRVRHGPDRGEILDVGRRTRTIPPALRRALEVRDRGCRFPGCGLRFTDAHHIVHWADGGDTRLENTILLCRYHHRLVHENGWTVEWWGRIPGRRPVFRDPRGNGHSDARGNGQGGVRPGSDPSGAAARHTGLTRDGPELPEHVPALVAANLRAGCRPDEWTASARWVREADIPDRVFFAALEATA